MIEPKDLAIDRCPATSRCPDLDDQISGSISLETHARRNHRGCAVLRDYRGTGIFLAGSGANPGKGSRQRLFSRRRTPARVPATPLPGFARPGRAGAPVPTWPRAVALLRLDCGPQAKGYQFHFARRDSCSRSGAGARCGNPGSIARVRDIQFVSLAPVADIHATLVLDRAFPLLRPGNLFRHGGEAWRTRVPAARWEVSLATRQQHGTRIILHHITDQDAKSRESAGQCAGTITRGMLSASASSQA